MKLTRKPVIFDNHFVTRQIYRQPHQGDSIERYQFEAATPGVDIFDSPGDGTL
jgi:hypothetical protein